jgi:glycosyltransferase involved in cell wall biosynthesis
MKEITKYNFAPLEKADLTIITLTYNSSKYIKQCVRSIIQACHHLDKDFQIAHLVIDGKSQDNTISTIQNISPTSLIIYRYPSGIYEAINYAVSMVKSDYLMYVHSDDEIDQYFIFNMYLKIDKLNQISDKYIFYGTIDFIDSISNVLFSRKPPFFIPFVQKETPIIFHPNAIYPTALEKLYPYNLSSGLTADHEHISVIASKTKLIRVPSAKYRFRLSSASSSVKEINYSENKRNSISLLSRVYIHLFEDRLISRLLMKLNGKTFWKIKTK